MEKQGIGENLMPIQVNIAHTMQQVFPLDNLLLTNYFNSFSLSNIAGINIMENSKQQNIISNSDAGNSISLKRTKNQIPFKMIESFQIFNKIKCRSKKQIKFAGPSYYNAFSYILLTIAVVERQNYPHLFTLIKQNFYKPGMFSNFHMQQNQQSNNRQILKKKIEGSKGKEKQIVEVCSRYFEFMQLEILPNLERFSSHRILEYLQNHPDFIQACRHMLTTILKSQSKSSEQQFKKQEGIPEIKLLCKKFNIDCQDMYLTENHQTYLEPKAQTQDAGERKILPEISILLIGRCQTFYFVHEKGYYFFFEIDLEEESYPSESESERKKKLRAERNFQKDNKNENLSERDNHCPIQVSQQSTPKFKENLESVRYRKKSHKNSFGGDAQIFNYNELANKLNRNNNGVFVNLSGNKKDTNEPRSAEIHHKKKVLSEKFEMNQFRGLTFQGQVPENIQNSPFRRAMRQSHIEGRGSKKNIEVEKQRNRRQSKLSSSAILQINTRFKESLESKESDKYMLKTYQIKQSSQINEISSPKEEERQKNVLLKSFQNKELQFQMSFSPKDAEKYVMKDDNQNSEYQSELIQSKQLQKDRFLYNIQPIIEQAQSSQQPQKKQDQSVKQSQQIDQRYEQLIENDGQFLQMFKNRYRNRKFSYLTQPIETGKRESQIISQAIIYEETQSPKTPKSKIHKTSEAVTDGVKRRFEENPISFSQIMASEEENFTGMLRSKNIQEQRHQKRNKKSNYKGLTIEKNVINFTSNQLVREQQNDAYTYKQPKSWTKRETVYYFNDRPPERIVVQKGYLDNYGQSIMNKYQHMPSRSANNRDIYTNRETSIANQRQEGKGLHRIYYDNSNNQTYNSHTDLNQTQKDWSVKKQSASKRTLKSRQNYVRSTIDTQILSTTPTKVNQQPIKRIISPQILKVENRKQTPSKTKMQKGKYINDDFISEKQRKIEQPSSIKKKFVPSKYSDTPKTVQQSLQPHLSLEIISNNKLKVQNQLQSFPDSKEENNNRYSMQPQQSEKQTRQSARKEDLISKQPKVMTSLKNESEYFSKYYEGNDAFYKKQPVYIDKSTQNVAHAVHTKKHVNPQNNILSKNQRDIGRNYKQKNNLRDMEVLPPKTEKQLKQMAKTLTAFSPKSTNGDRKQKIHEQASYQQYLASDSDNNFHPFKGKNSYSLTSIVSKEKLEKVERNTNRMVTPHNETKIQSSYVPKLTKISQNKAIIK